jgi:hypothetical protein
MVAGGALHQIGCGRRRRLLNMDDVAADIGAERVLCRRQVASLPVKTS